jgi:MFS family permease
LPLASNSIAATTFLLTVVGIGLYAIIGLFWTIPTVHLKPETRASGLAFINMCGVCGGIVSPALVGWLKVVTGSLYGGIGVVAILLILSMSALLAFVPPRIGTGTPGSKDMEGGSNWLTRYVRR